MSIPEKKTPVSSELGKEEIGICLLFQDNDTLPKINPQKDIAGIQHPLDNIIPKTHYNDPDLEAKAWPHLFPYGIGGWHFSSPLHIG